MRGHILALGILGWSITSGFAQGSFGQVLFANRVENVLDAPFLAVSEMARGPGPGYTVELCLQNESGSFTVLMPSSTFLAPGSGAQAIADRYWEPKVVEVPGVAPGEIGTFFVRFWKTSFGAYDAARAAQTFPGGGMTWNAGESALFSVVVGGGSLPPAYLRGLQPFSLALIPEPSILSLAALSIGALLAARTCRAK